MFLNCVTASCGALAKQLPFVSRGYFVDGTKGGGGGGMEGEGGAAKRFGLPKGKRLALQRYQVNTILDCSKPERQLYLEIGAGGDALLHWR